MRRVCLKFLVAVLVLAVASCNRSGAPERAKKIEHRTQTFDFGEARQGSVVHHTFRVANAGPQPMTVSKVQTSCGCTVATVKAGAVIGPGESLDVPVDLSLQGKKNPIESSVVVNYADGAVPDQLVLKGKVGEEYPGTVAFPDIKRGDRPEQVVTLSTYPGQPALEIKEIVNDAAKFDVTSRPGTKDGAVDIVVKPATNIAYGPVSDKLIVKTNDAGAPDKLIAVRAKVAKLLEPARRTMIIHPNKDGGPVTAVAEFTSTYGLPITDAVASISREKRFSAALEPDAPVGTVRVKVLFDPPKNLKKEQISGALRVNAKVGGEDIEAVTTIIYTADTSLRSSDEKRDGPDNGGGGKG